MLVFGNTEKNRVRRDTELTLTVVPDSMYSLALWLSTSPDSSSPPRVLSAGKDIGTGERLPKIYGPADNAPYENAVARRVFVEAESPLFGRFNLSFPAHWVGGSWPRVSHAPTQKLI
jgi:hypothetical protein